MMTVSDEEMAFKIFSRSSATGSLQSKLESPSKSRRRSAISLVSIPATAEKMIFEDTGIEIDVCQKDGYLLLDKGLRQH